MFGSDFVSDGSEFGEFVNCGGFVHQSVEGVDGIFKRGLGFLELVGEVGGSVGGSTGFFADGLFDRVRYDGFNDAGTDRLSFRAVSGGWAPVERVAAVPDGADGHSCSAVAAAKHSEPGEEPVRFGSSTATHFGSLNGGPKVPVDDGFVCVKVDVLPEVNLTQIDFRGEQGAGSVVGPVNAVFPEELPNVGDSGPVPSHFESANNKGCLVVGDKDSVLAFAVSRQFHIPSNDTPGDGVGLGGTKFLAGLSSVELVEGADKGALKPARSGLVGHLSEVHCDDPASGGFYAINDFVLDGDGSDEPVEVSDGHYVSFPVFDGLYGGKHSWPVVEGKSAGCVEFFSEVGELEVFGGAPVFDAVGLVAGRHESFAGSAVAFGHADDSDHSHCFNVPMYLRWVEKTVVLFLALGLAYMAGGKR